MPRDQINKSIFIIFTINDEFTDEIFKHLPNPEYYEPGDKHLDSDYPIVIVQDGHVIPINPLMHDKITIKNKPTITLVKDDQELNTKQQGLLKYLIDDRDFIYVAFHKSSKYKTSHKLFFHNINDRVVSFIEQHHTHGSVYDALIKIAYGFIGGQSTVEDEYFYCGIKQLFNVFSKAILDIKLKYLLMLLVPPENPGSIELNDNEWMRFIRLIENDHPESKFLEAWQRFKKEFKKEYSSNPFNENYIQLLSYLRDSIDLEQLCK